MQNASPMSFTDDPPSSLQRSKLLRPSRFPNSLDNERQGTEAVEVDNVSNLGFKPGHVIEPVQRQDTVVVISAILRDLARMGEIFSHEEIDDGFHSGYWLCRIVNAKNLKIHHQGLLLTVLQRRSLQYSTNPGNATAFRNQIKWLSCGNEAS